MNKRTLVISILAGAFVLLATAFYSPPSAAAPGVNWNPSSLTQALKPGESRVVGITLTATGDVPASTLRIVPEIAPYVTVSPTNLSALRKGQQVTLSFRLSAAITASPRTATGTVQLRTADATSSTISQPLPITLNVVWPSATIGGGTIVSYPPTLSGSVDPGSGILELQPVDYSPSAPSSDVSVGIYVSQDANPQGLNADTFYSVGPGADLGTAVGTTTVDGRAAFVYRPIETLGGDIVVIVPIQNGFIRITDHGAAFQANGIFTQVISAIRIGS